MPELNGGLTDVPDWWQGPAAAALLQAEAGVVAAALGRRTSAPWLHLGPTAGAASPSPDIPRGLRLWREGEGLAGPLRCRLPLPLHTETFGNVVVQHALDQPAMDGLLEECARVLEPGGRLWLFVLNPWSPYRLRWRKAGLHARDPWEWQARLRRAGLELAGGEVRYLGPVWSQRPAAPRPPAVFAGLRAICLLEATSRVGALIPPAPLPLAWKPGPAVACRAKMGR